jgi:hypothetical protein
LNINVATWDELNDIKTNNPSLYDEAEQYKLNYTKKLLEDLLGTKKDNTNNNNKLPRSPSMFTRKLIRHCINITRSSREFMENHPDKKLPPDYKRYPGKLDHSTCVAFKVGYKQFSLEEEEQTKASPQGEDGGKGVTSKPPIHRADSRAVLRKRESIWITCRTKENEDFFFNTITKESSWENPNNQMTNSPWKAFYNDKNEIYYYNVLTGQTSWVLPSPGKARSGSMKGGILSKNASMSNVNPFLDEIDK